MIFIIFDNLKMNKFVALVLILIALFETVDTAEKQMLEEPIF